MLCAIHSQMIDKYHGSCFPPRTPTLLELALFCLQILTLPRRSVEDEDADSLVDTENRVGV